MGDVKFLLLKKYLISPKTFMYYYLYVRTTRSIVYKKHSKKWSSLDFPIWYSRFLFLMMNLGKSFLSFQKKFTK